MKEYETTTQYLFASDFHNDYKAIINVINYADGLWQSGQAIPEVVLLGDYLDGYSNNKDVIEMANLLSELYKDIKSDKLPFKVNILRGNHDQFILDTINGNELSFKTWLANGGRETLRALGYKYSLNSLSNVKHFLLTNYPGLIDFLEATKIDFETENIYAVHAGLDWKLYNPKNTDDDSKLWIRDEYYYELGTNKPHRNLLDKVIVSGHTPSVIMRGDDKISLLKADVNDIPRYVIDTSSNSGYENGHVTALVLAPSGKFIESFNADERDTW